MDHTRLYYEKKGIVLTIKTSKENRVVLKCDRGGDYFNELVLTDESRQRGTHTRRIGCPFVIVCSSVNGFWAIRNVSGNHNHEVGLNLGGHAVKRRLSECEKVRVRDLYEQGVVPRDILSIIRKEFSNGYVTARDIYNETAKSRKEELRGRKPIEALLDLISSEDYMNKVKLDNGVIQSVFFMHVASLSLCDRFDTVFLLDSTYKTNKFNMPLLNIVGITSTYATFNAGFAFMHAETEEMYTWVLEQFADVVVPKVLCTDRELALMNGISKVFPSSQNLLCGWHINKNVLSNCKAGFTHEGWEEFMLHWNVIVTSITVESFEEGLSTFKAKYSISHPGAWKYIEATWLPHKERFISCFINEFPHFGSANTSRVEGNHHVVKSYLRVGTLHLYSTVKRLSLLLANQRVELNAAIEQEKMRIAHRFSHACFKELVCNVSHFALDKVLDQLKMIENGGAHGMACSGRFTKSWGLPCHHYIRRCLDTQVPISLQDVHEQWMLEKNPLLRSIPLEETGARIVVSPLSVLLGRITAKVSEAVDSQNPRASSLIARLNHVLDTPDKEIEDPSAVVKKRGRPAGSKAKTSTTRNKSRFEYLEGRRCGVCREPGHNRTTCPQKKITQ